jgi:hypothetical protein
VILILFGKRNGNAFSYRKQVNNILPPSNALFRDYFIYLLLKKKERVDKITLCIHSVSEYRYNYATLTVALLTEKSAN